jgi:hypothetical protein
MRHKVKASSPDFREPGEMAIRTSRRPEMLPPDAGVDHEHAWSPRAVEYVEGGPVEELGCDLCGDVWFR